MTVNIHSETINAIAEKFVFLDCADLQEMIALSEMFKENAGAFSQISTKCGQAANKISEILEGLVLGNYESPDRYMKIIEESIVAMQQILVSGKDEDSISFPDDLTLNKDADDSLDSAVSREFTLPPGVDEMIFGIFVNQQRLVLDEYDEIILNFEKTSSDEDLDSFRRKLHTMKGEAGVVGLTDLSEFCHALEDYLDNTPVPSADMIFAAKDWIAKAIDMYAEGKLPGSFDGFFQKDKTSSPVSIEEKKQSSEKISKHAYLLQPLDIGDAELAVDFATEANEHLEIADENLLILETNPKDLVAVDTVFRAFHTIKGVSGFLDLKPVSEVAHKAENLLDEVRKGSKIFKDEVTELTFASLDMLRQCMEQLTNALTAGTQFQAPAELPQLLDQLDAVFSDQLTNSGQSASTFIKMDLSDDDEENNDDEEENTPVPLEQPKLTVLKQEQKTSPTSPNTASNGKILIKQSVKVDADKLDLLIDTIGELVIAESIVSQGKEIRKFASTELKKNLSHLEKITRLLQDMGMSMRMVPIEGLMRKMARLVRDLAKKSNKKVDFKMLGMETELDRGIVEKLGDPLIHMIRNYVDHGIEPNSNDRISRGKPKIATVTLKAYHKGGSIHIEIVDDGRGLDKDAIIAKALEKKLISSSEGMADQEIFQLIFAAGFSTAKKVTDVSGRGVGMDVVKRNIEELRGKVLIKSQLNIGTTFTIVLPLTTAIIDGMLVNISGETYIIPTLSIIESLRPKKEMISTLANKAQMIQIRDTLMPMFNLSTIFSSTLKPQQKTEDVTDKLVVVVENEGKHIALVVDELLGQQQTVIKSMGVGIGNVPGIAGASILADGCPGLIIDIAGLVRLAQH